MTGILDALARVSLAPPPIAGGKRDILAALAAVAPKPERSVVSIVEPRDERPLRGHALQAALARILAEEPDRTPWPEDWFAGADPADTARCQRMWAECLRLSLLDVCETYCKDCDRRDAWDRASGVFRRGPRPDVRPSWIGSSDFHLVCAMAGLDGEPVAERVKAKLISREGAAEMGLALSAPVRSSAGPARSALREGRDD